MLRVVGSGLVALTVVAGVTSPVSAAPAHHHPSVSLHIEQSRISAGQRPVIDYQVKHVGPKAKLYLQRDFGTKHVFENVKRLKTHAGTVKAPAVQMGRYDYRVQVVRHKRVLADSAGQYLYSYGAVSALQLCQAENDTDFEDGCDQDTIQVGSTVYTYIGDDENGNESPDGDAEVIAQHSSCRSAFITYALSNDDADNGATTMGAELTQSAADPQSSTSSAHSIGSLVASISSSAWDLEFYSAGGYDVYWNASFSCWSANGKS